MSREAYKNKLSKVSRIYEKASGQYLELQPGKEIYPNATLLKANKTFTAIRSQRSTALKFQKDTPATSFKDLFGDLSNYSVDGDINLKNLKLSSLEGFPKLVVGHIELDGNIDIQSLENLTINASFSLSANSCNQLESLSSIHNSDINRVYKPYYLSFNDCSSLKDISMLEHGVLDNCKELSLINTSVSLLDIIKATREKRISDNNFSFLKSNYSEKDLERAYSIYEKLDFCFGKFQRAMTLV